MRDILLPVAAFVCAVFAQWGIVCQIDIECPDASDGKTHGHAHVYLAQRALERDGFGNKVRDWNQIFWRDRARYVRAVVAGRLTLACALLGIAAHADPRRNDERGLQSPEERLPAKLWRLYDKGAHVDAVERLKDARRKKEKGETICWSADPDMFVVESAVLSSNVDAESKRGAIKLITQTLAAAGYSVDSSPDNEFEIRFKVAGVLIAFDSERFRSRGTVTAEMSRVIVGLVQALDWPAVVVHGNSDSADEIISTSVPLGIAIINRNASANTLRAICEQYGEMLLDQVEPYDPLSVVATAIAAHKRVEANSDEQLDGNKEVSILERDVDFEFEPMPEPAFHNDEERMRRNAQYMEQHLSKQQRVLHELDELLKQIKSSAKQNKQPEPSSVPIPSDMKRN